MVLVERDNNNASGIICGKMVQIDYNGGSCPDFTWCECSGGSYQLFIEIGSLASLIGFDVINDL